MHYDQIKKRIWQVSNCSALSNEGGKAQACVPLWSTIRSASLAGYMIGFWKPFDKKKQGAFASYQGKSKRNKLKGILNANRLPTSLNNEERILHTSQKYYSCRAA